MRPLLKLLRNQLLALFCHIFTPILFARYQRQLKKISKDTQLFLLGRQDFGTFLYHVYYAKCWQDLRGKSALVLLTTETKGVRQLAELISPQTAVIAVDHFLVRLCIWLFRPAKFQQVVYSNLFHRLNVAYPQALFIFDGLQRSTFKPACHPDPFIHAYQKTRGVMDSYETALHDAFELHKQNGLARRKYYTEGMQVLRKELGIVKEFVVLNINSKTYAAGPENSRSVNYPNRHEVLIDALIAQGLDVVLQGRKEQPLFKHRLGLIDYSKSHLTSVPHDLALYSHCYFAMTNKTGPESFCTLCNTPQLGLNYTELTQLHHNMKLRFWPKHFYSQSLSRPLTWQEILKHPSYFDVGRLKHDADILYQDLTEDELLIALKEFVSIVNQPDEAWLEYTPEQQQFRAALQPLHLDLHDYHAIPCHAYLML